MDATFFSSIKKYKKSNAISFESVPLNIKIDIFTSKMANIKIFFLRYGRKAAILRPLL